MMNRRAWIPIVVGRPDRQEDRAAAGRFVVGAGQGASDENRW
jgi:hypothetical protein